MTEPLNVLFHYDATKALLERLAALEEGGLKVRLCAPEAERPLLELLPGTEVIWHVLVPITAAVMDRAPGLRLIQKIGVGVNTIDLQAARERGIQVANMPGTNTAAVAEMTLLLMLACLRRLLTLDAATRRGEGWVLPVEERMGTGELGGRVVGLIGMGAVPRHLLPILNALGAQVLYTNRTHHPVIDAHHVSLAELLRLSDIVSLHLPLLPETEHLIDAEALLAMKPGAILINTARGGLVDEGALIEALRERRIAGAGLDVFAREPLGADAGILALDNVVVAPHLAWLTVETLERSLSVAQENCRRLVAGEEILHRVA